MRTVNDILGISTPVVATQAATPPGVDPIVGQPGALPLGALTGAPPWTRFRSYPVIPFTAVGIGGQQVTMVVGAEKQSRLITFTAPLVGFTIYIGDAGVAANPGSNGLALPAGLPYTVELPGNQHVYAVTDAPVYLTLRVQEAALLAGDRERRF